MKHIRAILSLCCVVALLTGCATALPVQEVRQVNAAYGAAASAGGSLLEELAIAERRAEASALPEGTRTLIEGDVTVFLTFDAKTAASFASVGEPMRTSAQRRGLKVIGSYFDVLTVLAEGRNIEEAKARIQTLATNLSGLAALASGLTSALVGPVVDALSPIIDVAARTENKEELRRLVLEGAKPVDELIGRLIDSSPQIYGVLILESEAAAVGPFLKNVPARRAELLKIAAYYQAVANYVVLLEQMRTTFAALVATVRSPSPVTLASLNASANDLLMQAESVRRAYAVFPRSAAAGGAVR